MKMRKTNMTGGLKAWCLTGAMTIFISGMSIGAEKIFPSESGAQNVDATIATLIDIYGDGGNGTMPTALQWRTLLENPHSGKIYLIQLGRFRKDISSETHSENAAKYMALTKPLIEELGAEYLPLGGQFESIWIGTDDEQWDYFGAMMFPDRWALAKLFLSPDYVEATKYRLIIMDENKSMIVRPPSSREEKQ